jgi:hypothetical protein
VRHGPYWGRRDETMSGILSSIVYVSVDLCAFCASLACSFPLCIKTKVLLSHRKFGTGNGWNLGVQS